MDVQILEMESQRPTLETDQQSHCIFRKLNHPVTLKFEDVVYKISVPKKSNLSSCCDKAILKGVSGLVRPGEMLAMLGPSGSGKTTLLSALGGRLRGDLIGEITYNGKPFSGSTRRSTAFVTQDDVLYPHLTVAETLLFTALLRLPRSLSREEKKWEAEWVISELGLSQCRNSMIGGALVRGVSGGERKRVCIGQEMLVNPSLVLLDEPTSGLDSTTAQKVVSTMRDMVRGGRTVVMTIHQPSSRVFYMFDKVLLLSEGQTLYFGETAEALNYFSSVGYGLTLPMNHADFLLDLANGIYEDDSVVCKSATLKALVCSYKQNMVDKLKKEIRGITFDQSTKRTKENKIDKWSTSWWQQFTVLLTRGVKERRHTIFSKFKMVEVGVASIFAALLWWHSDISHLQDQLGLLFFYVVFWAFFCIFQAIFTFPLERAMLTKERSSGMYRLSSYFMARIAGDLPMALILPSLFLNVTYWADGLRRTAASYFQTLVVVLLNIVVAEGMGLAIGATVMNLQSATTLTSVIMLIFVTGGGYYVQNVPEFITWVKYISFVHHSYKLLLTSQYREGDMYPCGDQGSFCAVLDSPAVKSVGLDHKEFAYIALLLMAVGYRLIAYMALMRVGVTYTTKSKSCFP